MAETCLKKHLLKKNYGFIPNNMHFVGFNLCLNEEMCGNMQR